ncbi:hypothetical protein NKR23_g9187 [Pleurostoma richardsiae]|uniref:Uncharacterized protein n=1 Tax=Pleurostoma richardsiae TaxID=41990 RepID=A0AA38R762_9PEZI|nr:hypothetical protein NKR23_g9187 [Pleurostoma richardsiae]
METNIKVDLPRGPDNERDTKHQLSRCAMALDRKRKSTCTARSMPTVQEPPPAKEEPSDDPFDNPFFVTLPQPWQAQFRLFNFQATPADVRHLRRTAHAHLTDVCKHSTFISLVPKLAGDQVLAQSRQRIAEKRSYNRVVRNAPLRPSGKPPCLQCAAKDHMRCSLQVMPRGTGPPRAQTALSCARCVRNGERFCVQQKVDLTASHPAGSKAAEQAQKLGVRGAVWCADGTVGTEELLARAGELLSGGSRTVCGTVVDGAEARRMALPAWHANDEPGNRDEPEFRAKEWKHYFLDHWEGVLRLKAEKRRELWEKLCRALKFDMDEVRKGVEGSSESVQGIFEKYLVTGKLPRALLLWMLDQCQHGVREVVLDDGKKVELPDRESLEWSLM